MAIRQKFPTPPAEATASFDYADVQEGRGSTIYNLAQTLLSGSVTSGNLLRSDIYSDGLEVSGSSTAGIIKDNDFDIKFNRPQNLKGTVYLNIPHGILSNPNSTSGYLVCKIRRWDGTTETDIASATSKTLTAAASSGSKQEMHAIPIELPLTHFKNGETFRLTVEMWGNDANGIHGYGTDPQDRMTSPLNQKSWLATRLGDIGTIKSTINVPFVLKV